MCFSGRGRPLLSPSFICGSQPLFWSPIGLRLSILRWCNSCFQFTASHIGHKWINQQIQLILAARKFGNSVLPNESIYNAEWDLCNDIFSRFCIFSRTGWMRNWMETTLVWRWVYHTCLFCSFVDSTIANTSWYSACGPEIWKMTSKLWISKWVTCTTLTL